MKKKFYILLFFSFLISLLEVQAQQKATPKAGDGISSFLLRYNRSPNKYYDDFIKLNKKKLGKRNVLKAGMTYIIPPAKKSTKAPVAPSKRAKIATEREVTKTVDAVVDTVEVDEGVDEEVEEPTKATKGKGFVNDPLFGKQWANVKVTSNRLAGTCFYVVSGHGGPDPGAIGKVGTYDLHEDEYAYDIALRLARSLVEEGAEVRVVIQDAEDGIRDDAYLSNSRRETCMGSPIPLNQVMRLQQRCDKINTLYRKDRKNYKYCRAIFIHVDSRGKGKQTDVFFYHSNKKTESKRLANQMKNTFEAKYDKHQPNRGFSGTVSGRNLYVLAHTTPAAVFVELGNIQNTFDQRRLVMNSNRQAVAKWLMEGFLKDYRKGK